MKVKISLVNKITITIILSILLFGLLAIVFVYFYSKNSFLNNDLLHFEELSLKRAQKTSLVFNSGIKLAEAIAGDKLLAEYLDNPSQSQNTKILDNFYLYNIRNEYSAIYLMDKNGNTLISTDPSFIGKNYSFRDYFKYSISGRAYVDLAIGVTSKQLGYYFSHPVKDATGDILGVVVVKMIPDFVNETFGGDDLLKKIMLVDEYGIIVYSSKPDRLFYSLGQLSEKDQADLKQKRRYENLDIKPLQYQSIADNLNQDEKIVFLEYLDEVDNEEEIINIARIGDLPFFIITEESKNLYNSQAIKLSLLLAVFVFIAMALAIISTYLVIKNFLYLLNHLKIMANKLKANDFSYRINVKGRGDLVDIASGFNLVAENLQNNKINTEKIINKRTKQLEKINKIMVGRELEMVRLKNEINKLQGERRSQTR